MAQVIFSPIISDLRGKVADAVFSVWKGRPYIRQRVIPANPQSDAQTAVRESLARCVDLWQSFQNQVKVVWNAYYTAYRMSGFNGFMQVNRADEQTPAILQLGRPNPDIDPATTFAAATGAAAGEIDLTWTGGTQSADHKAYILTRKSGEDAFEVADADTTLFSAGSLTLSGLTAGATYDVYLLDEETVESDFSASKGDTADAHA